MKVLKNKYKCAVCGVENEYLDYMSNFVSGYSDFDLKPVGSRMGIGSNIMECPNCHYANYRIDTAIERRFLNRLELWNSSEEFQDIIKKYENPLRKILIVAKQYENNMDYSKAYNAYIMASWVCEEKEASAFRRKACEIFISKVLSKYNEDLLQIADILRMEKDFINAKCITNAVKELADESDDRIKKVIEGEINFIESKDANRHNLSEVF